MDLSSEPQRLLGFRTIAGWGCFLRLPCWGGLLPSIVFLCSSMADLAYLVIREGSKWSDVFQLKEGRTVTLGRAPTNQITVSTQIE